MGVVYCAFTAVLAAEYLKKVPASDKIESYV